MREEMVCIVDCPDQVVFSGAKMAYGDWPCKISVTYKAEYTGRPAVVEGPPRDSTLIFSISYLQH